MFSPILIIFVLTFIQKAVPFLNLSLIFLLFWSIRVNEKDTLVLAIVGSVFYDLFNNLILGSSLLGTAIVLALVLAYKKLVSQINLVSLCVIALLGSILWERVVGWVNSLF